MHAVEPRRRTVLNNITITMRQFIGGRNMAAVITSAPVRVDRRLGHMLLTVCASLNSTYDCIQRRIGVLLA